MKLKKYIILFLSILLVFTFLNSIFAFSKRTINKKFQYSVSLYKKLKTKKIRNKRKFSTKVIRNFFYLYKISKDKKTQAKSLFLVGKTYLYLAQYYQTEIFADLAISIFYRLNKEFPKSSLCDDSKYYAAVIYYDYKNNPNLAVEELKNALKVYPRGDYAKKNRLFLYRIYKRHPELKGYKKKKKKSVTSHIKKKKRKFFPSIIKAKYTLNKVRCLGFKNFSRVVFDFKKLPDFNVSKGRNYVKVTFKSTKKSKNFKIVSLNKNNLRKSLTFTQTKNSLNVKLKISNLRTLNYYTLKNPNRLVIDVERGTYKRSKKFIKPHDTIKTIIIDPGHGGHDPGAMYYGLKEKNVVLKIAKYVKYYLSKKLSRKKYTILLTRETDKFLSLEQRAIFANNHNADLFISIHCNAARDRNLHGFETYYLKSALNERYLRKRRNFKKIDYFLEEMVRTAKDVESQELASFVQTDIIRNLRKKYGIIEDLGIKEAPFYVLLGTRMPSILVENSFISNRMENKRLRSRRYLKLVANSIASGIVRYIKSQSFVK